MSSLTSIAAVAENGVIGVDGDMAWHIPADFTHFKRTTMGHPMIMGRKTFESMGVLPGRHSIIVTRDHTFAPSQSVPHDASVSVAHSVEDAIAEVSQHDAFIVGGAQIYETAMPYVTRLIISEIPGSPEGDAHFPTIATDVWREVSREPRDGFVVVTYDRSSA